MSTSNGTGPSKGSEVFVGDERGTITGFSRDGCVYIDFDGRREAGKFRFGAVMYEGKPLKKREVAEQQQQERRERALAMIADGKWGGSGPRPARPGVKGTDESAA